MSDQPGDFADLIGQVVRALDTMQVPYVIGGSVALTAWATPRTTHDLDLVVDLPASRVPEFCAHFGPDRYFIDADAMLASFGQWDQSSLGMYSFTDMDSGIKVDLFPLRPGDPTQQEAISRRVFVELLEGQRAAVYAPDDLLVQKLQWYSMGQSERQLGDCLNLLLTDLKRPEPLIAWDYVGSWATRLGPTVQEAWTTLKEAVELTSRGPEEGTPE
jgi:hypothetical protein